MNHTCGGYGVSEGPRAEVRLYIGTGQSNEEASNAGSLTAGTRVATTGIIDPQRALMLNTGLLGTGSSALDPATITCFSSAQEDATIGETGGASFMRAILAAQDAIGPTAPAYVYRTCGVSGASIAALGTSSTAYANLLATVTKAAAIAAASGRRLKVRGLGLIHGEADADSMSQSTYYTALISLITSLIAAVKAITGQAETPWVLILPLVAADGVSRNVTPVTLAQLQAFEAGLTIAPICCPYWFHGTFGFNAGQNVHWTPLGHAHWKEHEARGLRIVIDGQDQNDAARLGDIITRKVFDGSSWAWADVPFETSPRTTTVTRTGNIITGTVRYAEGGLSIYTADRGPATNSGFAWTPTTGTGTITGVQVINAGPIDAQWQVTLSDAASGGTLTYAITEQDPAADGGPDCWGDLHDYCKEVSIAIPDRTLRQGVLPFSKAVA